MWSAKRGNKAALTNDDLPPSSAQPAPPAAQAPSSETTPEIEAGEQDKSATEKAESAKQALQNDDSAKKKAESEAALKSAKASLAQAQSELDVLQRKAALDSDSFYSQTNFSSDTAGKALLDADAQQVNDKKAQVEALKAKIAALQTELGKPTEPAPQ